MIVKIVIKCWSEWGCYSFCFFPLLEAKKKIERQIHKPPDKKNRMIGSICFPPNWLIGIIRRDFMTFGFSNLKSELFIWRLNCFGLSIDNFLFLNRNQFFHKLSGSETLLTLLTKFENPLNKAEFTSSHVYSLLIFLSDIIIEFSINFPRNSFSINWNFWCVSWLITGDWKWIFYLLKIKPLNSV